MVKMVRGQGMPSYRHHDYGNLYIRFEVKFPEKSWTTDPQAFETLKAILPPSKDVEPAAEYIDVVDLEDADTGSQSRSNAMNDDDDDDHPAGAERVQCASQ
jgi:DnaJ family protein A protein 2